MNKILYFLGIFSNLVFAQNITTGNDFSLFLCDSGKIGVVGMILGGREAFSNFEELGVSEFVLDLKNIVSISAGNERPFALDNEGNVFVWGQNSGCHGIGHDSSTNEIVRIDGLPKIRYIKSKDFNAFAVDSMGNLYGWGANNHGSLGLGDDSLKMSPVLVFGISHMAKIATSKGFTLALLNDGKLMAWGKNLDGQLGLGHNVSVETPQNVNAISGVADIAVGEHHAMALDSNGMVWTWGRNSVGQLGDSTFGIIENSPRMLNSIGNISSIDAGVNTSYAVSNDGRVFSWGGDYSTLGHGQSSHFPIPKQIQGLNGVVEIAAGWEHVLARTPINTFFGWGATHFYELKDTTGSYWRRPEVVDFNCENVVGFEEIELFNVEIMIFPNPSDGRFEITLPVQNELINLKVYASDGKCILTSDTLKINAELDEGVYFVVVQTAQNKITQRIVIVK